MFLLDSLKEHDVRVGGYPHRNNDPGHTGERQRHAGIPAQQRHGDEQQRAEDRQSDNGHYAEGAVVEEQSERYERQTAETRKESRSQRVAAETRRNRLLTLALERGGQRAVAQNGGKILGLFLRVLAADGDDHVPGIEALPRQDLWTDLGRREHDSIHNDRHLAARVAHREGRQDPGCGLELRRALAGE